MAKKKYYAYYLIETKEKGILENWSDCEKLVKANKARYKSFKLYEDAKAWLDMGALYNKKVISPTLKKGIYFDAGTGRGIGVEVKVTDEKGKNILEKVVPKDKINKYGNYTTGDGTTNNYGELLGCYIALKIAINEGHKNIYGDSKLVIDYWSKGKMKKKDLPEATVELGERVERLRKEYEKKGGRIEHVSGDINPADLGFHK